MSCDNSYFDDYLSVVEDDGSDDDAVKEIVERNKRRSAIEWNYSENVKNPDFIIDYALSKEFYDSVKKYIDNETREFIGFFPNEDILIYMGTKYNSFEFANLLNFCHGRVQGKISNSREDIIKYIEGIADLMEDNHDYNLPIIKEYYPDMDYKEIQQRLLILRDKLNEISDYEWDLYSKRNIEVTFPFT